MIWLFALGIVLLVFAVLGADLTTLGASDLLAAFEGDWFFVMSILLLGCAFLCQKLWQISEQLPIVSKLTARSLALLLVLVMAGLFGMRALSVQVAFDEQTPKKTYTLQALVSIDEISDGVYDDVLESHYRQKATIRHMRLVENTNKYADQVKNTDNPFYASSDEIDDVVALPDEMTVMLSAFANKKQDFLVLNQLKPNTQVPMTLIVSPISREISVNGFDGYRWLRTRHIHANARILSVDGQVASVQPDFVGRLQAMRQRLREHFYQDWRTLAPDERQARAVTLALLTGDRALINRETKELYQFAGISHLLAISGTHVVFLAVILAWLALYVLRPVAWVYERIPSMDIRMMVMVGASLIYALFTGFDVPAMRTVYMLCVMAVVARLALPVSALTALVAVALLMIWQDPYVVWQAGFWLSFVAVVLLMRYDGQTAYHEQDAFDDSKNRLIGLIKLQGWLFFAMLPLSLWLFGKVSLWGLPINLFAVGLFGFVIVPINLLGGIAFVISPALADVFWAVSVRILWVLHDVVLWLESVAGDSWLYQSVGVMGFVFGLLTILPFVVPVVGRKFALLPAMAVVFLMGQHWAVNQPFVIQNLPSDDGKLSQVLIIKKQADPDLGDAVWLVVADFGSRMDSQTHAKMMVDALKKQGVRYLTGVIIQTNDGKLQESMALVHAKIPIIRTWQAGKNGGCQAGVTWQGDGLDVRILTGWGQIADERVHGCSVQVDGGGDVPVFVDLIDENVQTPTTGRVVINGANDDMAWQLYEMMCHADAQARTQGDIWLTHSMQAMGVVADFVPQGVFFTDKDNPKNRQKVREVLAMMD